MIVLPWETLDGRIQWLKNKKKTHLLFDHEITKRTKLLCSVLIFLPRYTFNATKILPLRSSGLLRVKDSFGCFKSDFFVFVPKKCRNVFNRSVEKMQETSFRRW